MKVTRLCLAALFLLTALAAHAQADTLVLTGGSLVVTRAAGGGFAQLD